MMALKRVNLSGSKTYKIKEIVKMASFKSAMQIRKDAERIGLDPNNYTGYQEALAREQQQAKENAIQRNKREERMLIDAENRAAAMRPQIQAQVDAELRQRSNAAAKQFLDEFKAKTAKNKEMAQ